MVVGSLLQKLNAEGYPTQGYADLAMMAVGKYLNIVAELIQRDLRKIDTWCKSNKLSVL